MPGRNRKTTNRSVRDGVKPQAHDCSIKFWCCPTLRRSADWDYDQEKEIENPSGMMSVAQAREEAAYLPGVQADLWGAPLVEYAKTGVGGLKARAGHDWRLCRLRSHRAMMSRRDMDSACRMICFLAWLSIALLGGCARSSGPVKQTAAASGRSARLANPASQHCVEQGARLKIELSPGGGQYGVCVFPDNRQCEEWALFRGECPAGGIRVAGYATPAARYCAITGGRYTVLARSGTDNEQGSCNPTNGGTCDADAYYHGTCGGKP